MIGFTDGSCRGNGKSNARAAVAVYILETNESFAMELKEMLKHYHIEDTRCTSQRAELAAILKCVDIMMKVNEKHTIHSDSSYSINCLTKWHKTWQKNDWKTSSGSEVLNQDLIKKILECLENADISFNHVRSHQKRPDENSDNFITWYGNDVVDKLASQLTI